MKKLWNKIAQFFMQSNRIMFAFYGFVITFVMTVLSVFFFGNQWGFILVPFVGAFIAFLTAFLKDRTKEGKFNWGDVLAGMIGSFPLILIMVIVKLFV